MQTSDLGLGGESAGLDFPAAYEQYKKDAIAAGETPLSFDEFVSQMMMEMQNQPGAQRGQMGKSAGLLSV